MVAQYPALGLRLFLGIGCRDRFPRHLGQQGTQQFAIPQQSKEGVIAIPPLRHVDAQNEADRLDGGATGRSEEHTSELQSLMRISYAVFCLKKKNTHKENKYKYQS